MKRWPTAVSAILVITGLCALVWLVGTKFLWPTAQPNLLPQPEAGVTTYRVTNITEPKAKAGIDQTELYRLINTYRTDHQLSPLRPDQRLVQSAQAKLSLMLKQSEFGHFDSDNQPNWNLLTQANYHYQIAGENLAFSGQTAWQVFEAWTKSASHSAQLLNPAYMDMGLAVDCLSGDLNQPSTGCLVVLHVAKEQ